MSPQDTTPSSVVAQAHSVIQSAKEQFGQHINRIPNDRYSADGYRAEVGAFAETEAARSVDKAVEQVRQRRDQAQTQIDRIRRDLSPNGDTAAELRASRYWDRTRRILDNLDSASLYGAAQDLLSTADQAELGTLLQEIPAYLQARGQNTEWIDTAVAQVVPEYSAARERLGKAEKALQITEYNAKALRKGFTEGRPPTVLADPHKYDPDS
jgi:hypothetical protein